MPRSPYYRLKDRHPLSIVADPATEDVWDEDAQAYVPAPAPGEALELEIHAERKGGQAERNEAGLDLNEMTLECRVVKSPTGKPLDFPETVRAGDTFPFTFAGRQGDAQLLPTPDAQLPKLRKKFGRQFELHWSYRG